MPHQCVRCGTLYSNVAQEIIKGCSCGSKLFFFVKPGALERAKEVQRELSTTEKAQIEEEVYEFIESQPEYVPSDEPVILDFESVNVPSPGKFELDLVNLFNKDKPVIYRLEEGKYMIDLPESFKRHLEQGKKK